MLFQEVVPSFPVEKPGLCSSSHPSPGVPAGVEVSLSLTQHWGVDDSVAASTSCQGARDLRGSAELI